jgi:ABC-type transporter Mla subunit MlaD
MNVTKYYFISTIAMLVGAAFTSIKYSQSFVWLNNLHAIVIFIGGFTPLVWYYIQLQAVQTKGRYGDGINTYLTDIEVDSIYYLGFLITLTTLVISVGSIVITTQYEIKTIISQFSLGLIATGFALWGRLDLQQRNERLTDPDSAVDEYRNKLGDVVNDIEGAYTRLQSTFKRASDSFEKSSQQLEVFSNSFERINQEMSGAANSLNAGMSSIQEKSENIDTALNSLLLLSKNLKQVDAVIADFSSSLKSLNKSGVVDVVSSVEKASNSLGKSAENFDKELNLATKNIASRSQDFTQDLEKSTQQLSSALTNLSSAMVAVANKVTDTLKR